VISRRAKIILAAMVGLAIVLGILLFVVPSVPEIPGTSTPQSGAKPSQ
jgi:hypothetical protein